MRDAADFVSYRVRWPWDPLNVGEAARIFDGATFPW